MTRFLLCWLAGTLIGWAAAESIVLAVAFTTPISTSALTLLAFLLGLIGGTGGGLYAFDRWGEA